ncbi:hypothetical protein KJ836_03345 [Patescibacteria group bacterium]|nr:hypothetical protein [Patescibacteria group bacterium]
MSIGPAIIRGLLKVAYEQDAELVDTVNGALTEGSAAQLTGSSINDVIAAWETAIHDSKSPSIVLVA